MNVNRIPINRDSVARDARLRVVSDPPSEASRDVNQHASLIRELRDVLGHLYDPIYLQRHPLNRLVRPDAGEHSVDAGKALRQLIVNAIEALRPFPSATGQPVSTAAYEILKLRYLEGLDRAEIQTRLLLGRSEYFREQQRGVEALALLLQKHEPTEADLLGQISDVPLETESDGVAPSAHRHNLPAAMTSYIARAGELDLVKRRLREARLLTLTGPGGCGKTRLATEVAREMVDGYADGVWLIELAPLGDPTLVPDMVAAVLEVRGGPGQPILATLLPALRSRRLLLILDNCEHLLDACARLADAILRNCPNVQILATSREALGITGEVTWLVPSLSLPPLDRIIPLPVLAGSEAIRLFVDRAVAVQPALTLTEQNAPTMTQICRRLDGIPLAIELAATRVKTLSLEHVATRLDHRFHLLTVGSRTALPRQQTLAATVDWSYDLLTVPERALFNRLSVFAGTFTLDAVEAVCGDEGDVLASFSALVDKSLVVAESGRGGVESYRLLETLRQYGRERLVAAGEAEHFQQRHASYYLQLAEEAQRYLMSGPEQLVYLARVNLEWDNIRAAMQWFLSHEAVDEGLRLSAALEFPIWYRGLDTTEGYAWRKRLLSVPVEATPTATRTNALLWMGIAASCVGDIAQVRQWLGDALAMARQIADDRVQGWVTHRVSRFADPEPERWYGKTRWELAEASIRHYRAAGDRWGMAVAQAWLGNLAFHQGDLDRARHLLIESVAIARSVGERHGVAFALRYLGEAAIAESDTEARTYLFESRQLYRELGDVQGPAYVAYLLGRFDCLHGRFDAARQHYETGLREFRDLIWIEMIVRSLNGLAMLAAGQGKAQRVYRIAAASARLRDASGIVVSPVEQAELDRALATARSTLGEAGVAAASAEGHSMTTEGAVAYALADHEVATRKC